MYTFRGANMKTISLLSQKGGAGKTLLSVNLASYAASQGETVAIIDIDGQASSCVWHDEREDTEELPEISVISSQPKRLPNVLKAAKKGGATFVVIDTSPNSEGATLEAAKNSDFGLIPCRAALADIKAIKSTVDLIKIANIPAGIVINACKTKGLAYDAQTALGVYGLPIADVVIGDRTPFNHAFTSGLGICEYEPKSKAANEIRLLYQWMSSK